MKPADLDNLTPLLTDRLNEIRVPQCFFDQRRSEEFLINRWILLVRDCGIDNEGIECVHVSLINPENTKERL